MRDEYTGRSMIFDKRFIDNPFFVVSMQKKKKKRTRDSEI